MESGGVSLVPNIRLNSVFLYSIYILYHLFVVARQCSDVSLGIKKNKYYTVDHLARGLMKKGANSVMPCELQDT